MAETYRSGDAFFAYDADLTVIAWNAAAEELTGIATDDALGRPCWDVLRGVGVRGDVVCHPGCSTARLTREGWPVSCSRMYIGARAGRKRVSVSTISVHRAGEAPVVLNVLRNGDGSATPGKAPQKLTARQAEVLQLLAEGERAKTIAARLGIAETTARNHIAGVLRRLGCHSQLEAVAEARRTGLV